MPIDDPIRLYLFIFFLMFRFFLLLFCLVFPSLNLGIDIRKAVFVIMVIITVKGQQNLDMDIKEYIMFVTIMVIITAKEKQNLDMDIKDHIMFVIIMATIMEKGLQNLDMLRELRNLDTDMDIKEYIVCDIIMDNNYIE